jgi:hypothetical protein
VNNIRLEPGSVILMPDEVERLRMLIVVAKETVTSSQHNSVMADLGREIRDILTQGQELTNDSTNDDRDT